LLKYINQSHFAVELITSAAIGCWWMTEWE